MKWYLIALKKYAEFRGRATRSEYWYFVLFNIIFSFLINYIALTLQNSLLSTAYTLAVLIPGIAVSIRRMHDVNKSGWFILIPFYNLILACTEGNYGFNKYDPDPKRPEILDDIDQIGVEMQS